MSSNDAPDDEWRECVGLPGYSVSIFGAVMGPRKLLRPYRDTDGYLRISAKKTSYGVHRLVAEAFLGPCPDGHEVAHKDHNRANPRLDNLEYLTHDANVKATAAAGRSMRGEFHVSANMAEATALAILARYEPGRAGKGLYQPNSAKALAREFGVSARSVHCLVRGETWKHLPRGASPQNPLPSNKDPSHV